jgi:predicted  nucleic acid-binding Zn-ribbon protein
MNRINKKDTRYDNELAQFETERTAIKDEIETLQTVIKENVEKTFKLFS